MIANYSKRKDVYYNNIVYRVLIDDLKHINKVDVIKLPNNVFVYWNDDDQAWKRADESLIELYINKKQIDVEFNGEIVKCISNLDLYHEIENELTTEVSIKCIVIFDKEKNIWIVLNKTDKQYKKYIETKSK